nr:MAG TPA: hypothetical protein [Caudoviricetes sp.]
MVPVVPFHVDNVYMRCNQFGICCSYPVNNFMVLYRQ